MYVLYCTSKIYRSNTVTSEAKQRVQIIDGPVLVLAM